MTLAASSITLESVYSVAYPLIRLIAAGIIVYYLSNVSAKPRLCSGILMAIVAGSLTFTFLEPLFVPVGMELAVVALWILSINAAAVGMSLGVLLPKIAPGACWGVALSLFAGCLMTFVKPLYFPISSGVLAIIGAVLSARWNTPFILFLANMLIGGGVVACVVLKAMHLYIMDVARGYLFHPSQYYRNLPDYDLSFYTELELGLVWIAASLLVAAATINRQGNFRTLNLVAAFRRGYRLVDTEAGNALPSNHRREMSFRDPPPASPDAYNMFDPGNLPPRLSEYANMVYSACEDLGNFFGFQDSSVRNQAEHLLILLSNNRRYMSSHILAPSVQPPSPIHALHAKVFSNYMKWCRAMGVPPNFSKMNASTSAPPAVASRVVDLVLFFCVWGEGSNLRHIPECLWFLYHKMMEEYIRSEGYTQTRSLYAGHYLDNVVTPIYEIVAKSMKGNKDHQDTLNYDDYNEFFWSRNCLGYRYSSTLPSDYADIEGMGGIAGPLPGEDLPSISEGLIDAPKTFLEKRSWLRGMLALNRILEWHIVTFYLLAVIAFARELVWGWVYSVQVASGVFWIFNALHLCWGLVEVWGSYPGIHLSGTAVCGSVFTLVARFLILVYQSLYLMWAFSPEKGVYLGIKADSTFWWWQYVWISLLCMIPYVAEALIQLWPALSTKIYTSTSDYVQSFLNILYPLSRLYVGKEVHESFKHSAVYFFYWGTLIVLKLFFSYVFEVYSMVLPTLQLTDDFLNYPNQSFAKMGLLLFMRWLPQFIVYCIDMSIWYAAWQAFAGTSVGFAEHLGDIRSINDIRENFGSAPENFCAKMLSPDAGSRRGSSASFLGSSGTNLANAEGQSLLGADPHKLQGYVNRILDVRIQKWVMFSAAWNNIIDHFREEDIVSNWERDNLKFSTFDGFSQAIYLPVFQTAGVIDNVLSELERPVDEYKDPKTGTVTDDEFFKPITQHVTMRTAVSEVWELGSYLFSQMLGPVHHDDVTAIMSTMLKWSENGTLSSHMKLDQMRKIMDQYVAMVDLLETGLSDRTPASKPRAASFVKKKKISEAPPSTGMRRAVSATSLASLEKKQPMDVKQAEASAPIVDALRDQVRDKFRNLAYGLKGILKNTDVDPESTDVLDRLTFLLSMENGFLWDDAYASDQLDIKTTNEIFRAVLKKSHGLVACHPDDVEPKSKEVRRRLTWFTNSLFMDMPYAPSIHDMFSWTTLTPYYSEDVTYTKGDLEKRTDTLGVSTLLYLQTLFRADWNNFLERLGIEDEEKIWSKKYINETRKWASMRAQTLSRTVHGMMYYEKALRLLADMERIDEDTANDLLGEKFGYVVSCQVYGNMKRNQDKKADDIDHLMHTYPHLRVAYIDNIRINRAGSSMYYSVLVKSNGKGKIEEIYRVRLPGNPIIGEGKPENQNHAMIFTRSEFLQTIDMNQEGYFEEALKMRNLLQEFAKREGPLPTTILGFREHIFTGSVSSLANYMALQETSFVTLGQRVLTKPVRIRLHYGHPDLFDKLFSITRGGISKASKGINLSEDVFAGYNNVIRGGSVSFKEYIQVGKGRDVGMSQIYKFEAKLSQGAAEQSLSRDMYRMCQRLDFCRLLGFYFGGIGHYFSNVLTVLTVYVVVYLMAVLAIFDLERIGDRIITPMGTIQMLLGGLGLLQTVPLFATLGVERGWWASVQEIIQVFVTGGPLHFMFHIQTKAYYMSQTILAGGAKYRATGRGFVTQHTPFDEQYRFFASSHLYLGIELAAGLILMGVYTSAGQYFGRTWSLWLASLSFLASPFWFNPLTFDWDVVVTDYVTWLRWMQGSSGGPSKSWSMWWTEENSFYKTMPLPSKLVFVIKSAFYIMLEEGIRRSDLFQADIVLNTPTISVGLILGLLVVLFVASRIFTMTGHMITYPIRRTIGILLFLLFLAGILIVFIEDSNWLRYTLAAYYGIGALCLLGLMAGVKLVKPFYLIHDYVCGHLLFFPLFILGALQLPRHIQTWLLYHNALSSDVVVSDILRYARKTQENMAGAEAADEDLVEQIAELKKIVQKQELALQSAGLLGEHSPNAVANLVSSASSEDYIDPTPQGAQPAPRTLSMSGMDVWGNMALGDVAPSISNEQRRAPTSSDHPPPPPPHAPPSAGVFKFTQPEQPPPR